MTGINLKEDAFKIQNVAQFETHALELFHFQLEEIEVYRHYCTYIDADHGSVTCVDKIPYLPIEFFKTHEVYLMNTEPDRIFLSSGTTGGEVSKHGVSNYRIYELSYTTGFKRAYGDPGDFIFLCLLPNYQQNPHSSLIAMMEGLITRSGHRLSGFYLDEENSIVEAIKAATETDKKVMLFGVSYALLDLAERGDLPNLGEVIIMETGGMKGKRKEMVKEELHETLKKGFGVDVIHSEYGMTELLSQAYSKGEGRFIPPLWMRVSVRDANDPLVTLEAGRSGGLNIIDLANVHSCAFIATQDLGKVYEDGSFEVLGRFDHSDIRGCNLLVAE